jgi:2-polyprenyl-6-hydroxyphenyl methylase/3-demethylubiquinone-9 3-methyltransferase
MKSHAKINNQIYDDPENSWWDENNPIYLLRSMVNPWRVPYFSSVLKDYFGKNLTEVQLLDIGCGGGYLTEEFARLGCKTSGVDISSNSIQAAKTHALNSGLTIDYRVGSATDLDFRDDSFDVISCCDVLEHIVNWSDAITEITRVLSPGGILFFDTINRTFQSYLTMIFGLQIFPLTSLFPPQTHIWRMFITPEELSAGLESHGFELMGLSGGTIKANPAAILFQLIRYKTGRLSASHLGQSLQLTHSSNLSQNYLGYGRLTNSVMSQ